MCVHTRCCMLCCTMSGAPDTECQVTLVHLALHNFRCILCCPISGSKMKLHKNPGSIHRQQGFPRVFLMGVMCCVVCVCARSCVCVCIGFGVAVR
jgi:hypothetical protein